MEDSNTEQSDIESDSDEEEADDFYICNRKKGKKIIESFSRKKTPYTTRKKTDRRNLLTRLAGVIEKVKNRQYSEYLEMFFQL